MPAKQGRPAKAFRLGVCRTVAVIKIEDASRAADLIDIFKRRVAIVEETGRRGGRDMSRYGHPLSLKSVHGPFLGARTARGSTARCTKRPDGWRYLPALANAEQLVRLALETN